VVPPFGIALLDIVDQENCSPSYLLRLSICAPFASSLIFKQPIVGAEPQTGCVADA